MSRLSLVWIPALVLGLLAPSVAQAADPVELTLESGLRVLLLPHPGSGLVASNVFVGAGSTREEARFAGSSHFLEHVLFNGTTRRTQEEIYAHADRIGAYNNATTRREYTHYMMVAPSERLADALDLQADMLLHSTLPPEKFEKERGIVLEELSKDRDNPDYAQGLLLESLLFGEDGDFARPVLGTEETIAGLPRDSVVEYYRRQYVPGNMRLVLMGDFETESALGLVRKLFAAPAADQAPIPAPEAGPVLPSHVVAAATDAPVTVVELYAHFPAGTPEDDAALAVLAHLAGGSQSGRLERAMDSAPELAHEEGSASAGFVENGRTLTLRARLTGEVDVRDAATRVHAAAVSLFSVGTGELAAARTHLLSQEISQLEQLHYYALFQGDRLWHMEPGFTPKYLAALEAMDVTGLRAATERLSASASIQITAAGPGLEEISLPLEALEPSPDLLAALQPVSEATGDPIRRARPAPLTADQPPTVTRLDNGLTVIHSASGSTRMFAMHLLVKDRSWREPAVHRGMADLLHRTMGRAVQQSDAGGPSRLDRIGGEIKVADSPWIPYDDYYTTPLYSFVRLESVDEYHAEALGILGDMLTAPYGDEALMDEARNEMMSAIQRAGSKPSDKARALFRESLYPGHPLAESVMGDGENLAGVTYQDLAEFAPGYLSPDKMILSVVGNAPRDEVMAAVERALGGLESMPSMAVMPPVIPLTEASRREEAEGGGNQSALRLGKVVRVDPADRWALTVATRIASDRMQQDLRETRGLAYSLGMYASFRGDRATIAASMGTRPENVAEAETGMLEHFTRGTLEVTAEEIETAVNKHLSRTRMRRVTSMGQAFTLGSRLFLEGDVDFDDREAAGLAGVTPEDVNRVAGLYLGDGNVVTVIVR